VIVTPCESANFMIADAMAGAVRGSSESTSRDKAMPSFELHAQWFAGSSRSVASHRFDRATHNLRIRIVEVRDSFHRGSHAKRCQCGQR
jgi:hypothetical protein